MSDTTKGAPAQGLRVDGIVKRYSGVAVLKGVSVTVKPGEVVGLVGHNGAGKSTLMRMIAGADRPDSGTISIDGTVHSFSSPAEALEVGIGTVYQELSLLPNLTVTQNVFLGDELTKAGLLKRDEMREIARDVGKRFGLKLDPDRRVGDYPVATRQLLEIAIATRSNAKYLMLDEPTTSLEGDQVDSFLEVVRSLADDGLGIIFVDHKLEELYAVATRVVALVDGEVRINQAVADVSRTDVIRAIAGDEAAALADTPVQREAPPAKTGEATVTVRGLKSSKLGNVNLDAHAGHILGLYGLVGSGRTEILRAIAGLDRVSGGSITIKGRKVTRNSPQVAQRNGIAYLSEERKIDGIVPGLDSPTNVILPVLSRFRQWGFLQKPKAYKYATGLMDELRVKGNRTGPVASLSGGNQQKVLFARVLAQEPQIVLLDEPTKGVDLAVKAEIHRLTKSLAHDQGLTVIVVSSEEDEICDISDEVIVVSEGSCAANPTPINQVTPAILRETAWAVA
ncbi:sugar ABC transporter ATP-binding protein [Bifidobacterium aquikefiricola]|uniref:Sugar ABC transporter ATP-binding protein n=1 Tax=Bifidobacterium aquikefiricola TaxID=3059038 RepID=A0AB39U6G8_9BIFI